MHVADAPYCGPYGGRHTYTPMFVPNGVGLLRPPKPFPPFTNESTLVPVMRTEDHYPMHFFYFAEGCSDTYIRASASDAMVAYDRLDALRRLEPKYASKILVDRCSHQIEASAVRYLPAALLAPNASTNVAGLRTAITGSGCLNDYMHILMATHDVVTLVLNYEAPGFTTDTTERARKTEIVYRGADFYDAAGQPCALERRRGCYFCNNSIRSRATCNGTLHHALRATPSP